MLLKQPLFFAIVLLFTASACNTEDATEKPTTDKETMKSMNIEDPHSYAKPAEAVIEHLDLQLNVNFDEKVLKGVAMYKIDNKEGVDQIYFDTRDLTIEKIHIGKNKLETTYELGESDPLLGQKLSVDIEPGTEFVTIYYNTSPNAAALQWLNPQQTAGKQHPYLFTQSQAILARTWIPIQDSPGIRFTYNANVTVPNELLAVMSAENPMKKNATGKYSFEMNQPIPSYLMALAVGDLAFLPIDERTGVYAEPSVVEAAKYEFDEMDDMLEEAEGLYGEYRWDRYDVIVLPPSFPFGGMENPRLTFATPTILAGDRSLTALIAHELAHSWSGNLVTNANWDDFWLNEGFTVYFEQRIMEALYGESYSNMLRELSFHDLQHTINRLEVDGKIEDTKLKLNLAGRDPDEGLTHIAYDKGALFLRHIEETVGREQFDAFLNDYFNEHAFEVMTTEEFVDYLNEELIKGDEELAEAINADGWIYGTGLPNDHPVVNAERFDQVEAQITRWRDGAAPTVLDTEEWTSHEWQYFLRNLPENIDNEKLAELDEAYNFTQTGNSEVAALWLNIAIVNKNEAAYDRLEEFLMEVGRRKFLQPLYETMAKTEEGKAMAREIYAKARPNYHSVSYLTIDKILDWEEY